MDQNWGHLLDTNLPPSDAEKSALTHHLHSLNSSISSLSSSLSSAYDDLQVAKDAVKDLHHKQSTLWVKKKRLEGVVSGFRRLPEDLVREIICCAVWSGASPSEEWGFGRRESDLDSILEPMSTISISPHNGVWSEPKQLATLTRVCKDWSRTALNTPLLWNTLHLRIYHNDNHFGIPEADAIVSGQLTVQVLQKWFDRAGDVGLCFTMVDLRKGEWNDKGNRRLAEFIWSNRVRWRVLKLGVASRALVGVWPGYRLLGWESESASTTAVVEGSWQWTNLETLALYSTYTESTQDISKCNLIQDRPRQVMPRLRSLSLYLPHQVITSWDWIPWSQLTALHLRSGDLYEDVARFLERCVELRTCETVFRTVQGVQPAEELQEATLTPDQQPFLGSPPLLVEMPVADVHGPGASAGGSRTNAIPSIYLPHLDRLEVEITFIVPLVSKLCLPRLSHLAIRQDLGMLRRGRSQGDDDHQTQLGIQLSEEKDVGKAILEFVERSSRTLVYLETADEFEFDPYRPYQDYIGFNVGSSSSLQAFSGMAGVAGRSASNATLPLKSFDLQLYTPAGHHSDIPRITIWEYIQLFGRLEALETLYLKDGVTNAEFLELADQRAGGGTSSGSGGDLLPNLKRIWVEVGENEEGRKRFERFVESRTRRGRDSDDGGGGDLSG